MSFPTFRDGKRSIDFILVYKTSELLTEKRDKCFKTFTKALQSLGIQMETENFSVDSNVVFLKLYIPDDFIISYADVFDVELACMTFDYRPYIHPPRKCMSTPLTRPNVNDPVYARAPASMGGEIPKQITSAERIMVVHQMLTRIIWGPGRSDYGIERLMRRKILIDAYPLHDGDYKWTPSGPLNDRQLLALYWGGFHCWNKAQPLNLVEKYFGTEYAMYFAWLGMYVKHLIPVAILSVLVVSYGVATMFTSMNVDSHGICESNVVMCPRCHYRDCPIEMLSNSCYLANITYLFDNWCAVIFAGVMSLWATVFMELWQREESVLELQWNLQSVKEVIILRPEFLEIATKRRYCPVTERMQPYIPKAQTACRYTLTLASLAILLLVVLLVTFGVMVYRVAVNVVLLKSSATLPIIKSKYRGLVASTTGAMLSAVFIFIFKWLYEKIAMILTNMENHRTQAAYHNAYIFKSYALAFANNYSAAFYIAFFKGKFYTYPGDMDLFTYLGGINTDTCDPTGCITDMAILLITIMLFKAMMSNITQVLVPKIMNLFNKTIHRVKNQDIPQWEKEYLLSKTEEFFIIEEYMDMVIQYGFVNFFIMGFPLAPALALLNNVIELRVDASKITKSYRRPIPAKVAGLGAWFGILQAATYIGVFTNALVIAFTSNFMEKSLYRYWHNHKHTTGFLNHSLSIYDMRDFTILDGNIDDKLKIAKYCYYPGKRYPPWHHLGYKRRKEYWFNLAFKFLVVVVFEHILIFLKGFLAYAIPDVPFAVRQQVLHREQLEKKAKVAKMHEQYMKKVGNK